MASYVQNPITISNLSAGGRVLTPANYGLDANALHRFVVYPEDTMPATNAKALVQSNTHGPLNMNFITQAKVINIKKNSQPNNNIQSTQVAYETAGLAQLASSKSTKTSGSKPEVKAAGLGTLIATFK